jgi:hypothetical protein
LRHGSRVRQQHDAERHYGDGNLLGHGEYMTRQDRPFRSACRVMGSVPS